MALGDTGSISVDSSDPLLSVGGGGGGGGGGGIGSLFGNNPGLVGALGGIGALGLGVGLLNQGGQAPYTPQVQGLIGSEAGFGASASGLATTLTNPLLTGQLPSDAEAQIQQTLKQSQDQVRARFAAVGQTGSTMEADTLADLTNKTSAMRFQIAQNMAQLGQQYSAQAISAFNLQGGQWTTLMQQQMAQNKQSSDALSGFFSAVGGSLAKALPALAAA